MFSKTDRHHINFYLNIINWKTELTINIYTSMLHYVVNARV